MPNNVSEIWPGASQGLPRDHLPTQEEVEAELAELYGDDGGDDFTTLVYLLRELTSRMYETEKGMWFLKPGSRDVALTNEEVTLLKELLPPGMIREKD